MEKTVVADFYSSSYLLKKKSSDSEKTFLFLGIISNNLLSSVIPSKRHVYFNTLIISL